MHVLRIKHIRKIWGHIATLIVSWGGVRIASYLTYLGIEWGKIDQKNPTVLCISRDFFSKDIVELRKRTQINYPCILGGYARFQQNWFPEEMQVQTFYQNYQELKKQEAIAKSTEYARRILLMANKVQKIDAVMSANFDYWQDIGFKNVCLELAIPFLVLSREHTTIPASYDLVVSWYKKSGYKFQGTAIAVGGGMTAKIFDEVPIIDTSNVWVIGLPRFDIWQETKTDIPLNQRLYITLLTYTDGYMADENFKEVVKLFAAEALKYHNLEFIVKCKNYDDQLDVLEILENHNISRLKFVYDIPLYEILPKSRLVINYNSLSIVEAVMARAKVAIPDWGDCRKEEKLTMCSPSDPIVSRAVSFIESPEEFSKIVEQVAEKKDMTLPSAAVVQDFVNKYFYMPPEGTISQKVEEFIRHYL